jgi:pimeloyl-ACP methyl ester carboxylesterase
MTRIQFCLAFALALAACARNGGVEETLGSEICDGLDESHCLFPFPSDHFRKNGKLAFSEKAMPRNADQAPFSPEVFNRRDGYSAITPIYFRLPGATLEDAPSVGDIAGSLSRTAKTLIVDADTGELIPHWAEIEHFTENSGKDVIALRLARKLMYEKRYIVAVRRLVGAEASRGFAALRDGTPSQVVGIDARREHFDAKVFAPLERLGVKRTELQLAFDFTVGSEDNATKDMHAVVDLGLAALPAAGPDFTIDSVETYPDGAVEHMVRGTLQVPSFLEAGAGLRKLRRDENGLPLALGTEAIAFELQIPRTAGAEPAAVIQYGHGLLGSKREARNGWLADFASRKNFWILAIDMQGMAEADQLIWADTFATDIASLPLLADKTHQGVLNHVVATRMMKTSFVNALTSTLSRSYDPQRVYYYGNSQGGTMGALITTLHPDIQRSVLGVPGCAFTFLLSRSVEFTPFATLVQSAYPNVLDFVALLGLVQVGFDRMDPINYAHRLGESHTALLHVAVSDAQVDNQVSEVLGRTVNATQRAPVPVFGLPDGPITGNAYVVYDFGKPPRPATNAPVLKEHDTHALLRRHVPAQEQLWRFLESGIVD